MSSVVICRHGHDDTGWYRTVLLPGCSLSDMLTTSLICAMCACCCPCKLPVVPRRRDQLGTDNDSLAEGVMPVRPDDISGVEAEVVKLPRAADGAAQ